MSDLHALYRFYAGDDTLLYVGITNDPGNRFTRHRADKTWWYEIATVRLQYFDDRLALARAERQAIEREDPVYNIRMNHGRRDGTGYTHPGDAKHYTDACEHCGSVTTPTRWGRLSNHGREWHYECECGYRWTCWYGDRFWQRLQLRSA